MDGKLVCEAIAKCDHEIVDYERRLNAMYPSFLYDYETIQKLNKVLLNTLACRDMLTEMLKEGDKR